MHTQGLGPGQGAAGPRLFLCRGHNPNIVGQGSGYFFQTDKALSGDTVIIGQEDTHPP